MLLKFFRKPLPSVLIATVFIGLLSWLGTLLSAGEPPVSYTDYGMPLFSLLISVIPQGAFWAKFLALLMVMANGLLLIQMNTKYILVRNRTHLPALFYILLCSGFTDLQTLTPSVFSAFFVILALDSLFATLNTNHLDGTFKAGFLISLGTLFYLPTVSVFLLMFFAIVILNLSGVRPWLAAIAGFITPLFFTVFYYYYFNDEFQLVQIITSVVEEGLPYGLVGLNDKSVVWLSFTLLLMVVSGINLMASLPTQKINVRKYHSVLLLMLLLVGMVTAFVPFASVESLFLFSIPFSYLLSSYFNFVRNRFWSELLFSLLLVMVLLIQLF